MLNSSEDSSSRSGRRVSPLDSEGSGSISGEEETGGGVKGEETAAEGSNPSGWGAAKTLEQESLHEPAALLLWAETTDHKGGSKAANSSTAQRLFHGTFVRTLTVFADFWVPTYT